MSVIEHPAPDCTCPFCEAMRVARGAYENMDAYAKRLRGERDAARQQLEGAVEALRELITVGAQLATRTGSDELFGRWEQVAARAQATIEAMRA